MGASVLAIAAIAQIAGVCIALPVIRWIDAGNPELAFVLGAVLGTQLAAMVHHRHPGAVSSAGVKTKIGFTLALMAIALGLALQATISPFAHPEVSIPLAAIGSFIFPFVIFDTTWRSLSK